MNQSIEKVSAFLFGDKDINAVTTDAIQQFADEHPYFSIGQLLLSKKLKAEKSPAFLSQVQKTASYFSNPYWLHYQLDNDIQLNLKLKKENLDEEIFENEEKQVKSFKVKLQLENDKTSNKNSEPAFSEENNFDKKYNISNQAIQIAQALKDKPEEEIAAEPETPTEQPEASSAEVEEIPVRDKIEEIVQETLLPDEQNETTEVLEEMVGATDESSVETEAFLNEATDLGRKAHGENVPEEPVFKNIRFPEKASFFVDTKQTEPVQDEHDLMFKNIKAMLDATSEEADADVNDTFVPIDPYYTIDYFASQGIKLDLDPNPKDELGQHLKKFTHWLKQMKKLGPEDATEVIARNNESEADIQKIADSSNTVREVVTEAMASVLEKQGKKDKAIELYNKLSFLNPDKSIYFAGKIKSLKGV